MSAPLCTGTPAGKCSRPGIHSVSVAVSRCRYDTGKGTRANPARNLRLLQGAHAAALPTGDHPGVRTLVRRLSLEARLPGATRRLSLNACAEPPASTST